MTKLTLIAMLMIACMGIVTLTGCEYREGWLFPPISVPF